jgi:cysteinyl-tRNA synthetase
LSAHYTQPLDWNDNLLNNQKEILDKWYKLYDQNKNQEILDISDSLLDDLNTPGFIAKIHELYQKAKKGDQKSKNLFNSACRFIGLFNVDINQWNTFKKKKIKISEEFILNKIKERLKARKDGDFDLADKIRDELLDSGILIEDNKDKTEWKFK